MPPAPPAPASAARTLHALLFTSTLIVSVGALVVSRSVGAFNPQLAMLDYAAIFVGLSTLPVVWLIWSRLPDRAEGQSLDQWWQMNTGRAVALWALLEFPGMVGAGTLFLTGRLVPFGILVMLAIGGFVVLAPGRLAGN